MDIGQLAFPFIMAVLTNSLMIVAIYFLRKIPYFANLFSIWFMIVLYMFCILRVFLPIELPSVQIILRDNTIYNFLVESMAKRSDYAMIAPGLVLYIILGVWLVGTIVFLLVSLYIQKAKTTYYLANYDFTTDHERILFRGIADEILGKDSKIYVKKTDAVSKIIVIGYQKKYVFLPVGEYSDAELEMIFRHECTHIKNKDLWLKLLIHIYCCIFWWNPFSYLLKLDLSYTLEMKCDLVAVQGFSDDKVQLYFDALTKRRGTEKKDKKKGILQRWFNRLRSDPFFLNAEFSDHRKAKELFKRIRAITAKPSKRVGQVIVNTVVSLVFVAIFVASYIFIWQPFYGYDTTDENYQLIDDEIIVDDTNSYLVPQEDGSYLFYFKVGPPVPVSKEEYEQGLYKGYPILDN